MPEPDAKRSRSWPWADINPFYGVLGAIVVAMTVGLLVTPYYYLCLAPGLAVLALFFLFRYPQFGYLLIVFLIPSDAFREVLSASRMFSISKLIGFWILLVALLSRLPRKSEPATIRSNLWAPLGLFFVVGLLSAMLSDYPLMAFDSLRQLAAAYVFFGLSLVFANGERMFSRTLPRTLVAGVVVSALLAIVGFVFNIPLLAVSVEPEAASIKRGVGAATDANVFSAMIIFSLPLIVYLFQEAKRARTRLLMAATFLISVTAIVLTYSRGGALIAALVVLLLVAQSWHRLRVIHLGWVGLALMGALVLVLLLVPSSYWQRQKSLADVSDESLARRFSYLVVGWDAFKQDPLLGSGPGTFRSLYAESRYGFAFAINEDDARRYAHNTYLDVLVGTGCLGLGLLLVALAVTARNFTRAARELAAAGRASLAGAVRAYRLSWISLLLYFLILSIFNEKFFWLSLALSQVALTLARSLPEQDAT